MSNAAAVLEALMDMSRELGRPERDFVILGEGNTSALCDDGTFWVKGSGTQLGTIDASGFVQVRLAPVCALANRPLEAGELSDAALKAALQDAKVDPANPRQPSVETVLHALALSEAGARYVGHTHPVAVNALTCSRGAEEALAGRLFPDEIVVCGPAPLYVPYTDPGLPLARAVRDGFRRYADQWGSAPKAILMQNHGLIALGGSPREVDNVTAMCVKTCRILAGTFSYGGPLFMTEQAVERIHTRPDEAYRRKQLGLQ
ncbi:MAG: class II aldolase [Chloroflexi bacterium]|nr:class II aldolase [Chloroflexota bacterium]